MSVEFRYFVVNWKQVKQCMDEQEVFDKVESEEIGYELEEISDDSEMIADAWSQVEKLVPKETWLPICHLINAVSIYHFEKVPRKPQAWLPADREWINLSLSPTSIKKWLGDYNNFDWEMVSQQLDECWPKTSKLHGVKVENVASFLQNWQQVMSQIMNDKHHGLLIATVI